MLFVISVENELANTKFGAGGPEEAVMLSGYSGWWLGGGREWDGERCVGSREVKEVASLRLGG